MAETEAEAVPNGTGGLSAEEDDERLKQRPADIDADVREMERRKRVEAIMSSRLFREELERVLDQQLSEGGGAAPLLQRIREMVGGAGAARLHAGAFKGGNCVLPINDIRGIEGMGYEKGEKILRCKLAAVYRLVDLYGWTQAGHSGQITARLNTAVEHFLAAPRGLLPHEVTASSLVKVDMQGVVQDQGTTNFPVNLAGFSLHACVHAARPDVRCVLHVRSPAALAVSAQRDGLLPLSSEAALLGDLAYHRLPPGVLDNEERDKLVRALGPTAKVLILSNGGALCCGETLEEAFHQARCLTAACDVQLRLAAVPLEKLTLLDDDARKQIYDASRRPPADGAKWRVGGEEFEALMRMLDNAGYRTGYIYRHPLVKGDVPKPKNDVEVPPAVSSLGYLLEEEELYRQGLWKKMDPRKAGDRTRWLNSPNVYQKVEVLETGTSDPKKITKWVDANNEEWVQDGSPAHSSTPVKIDAALQFVPKNTNPKEFKKLQQQIKDNRRADKISAGPQSHILEGVTWDEANKLNAEDAAATHTGDHVVLMGAASKGIIQRGYQHNATVYSAPYARNPFDQVSDRELDEYKRTVERKARGEYDADVSESEGVSAALLTSPDCQPSETEEESRDDHRILRIETKQAPRPSQPEVVLSDDSTDFLAAERRAAEHTPRGDSVFSDDEVFLERAPAPLKPAVAAAGVRVGSGVLADGSLLVRSYRAPAQQTVATGKKARTLPRHASRPHASSSNPATITRDTQVFSTNQRSLHDYPRSPHFQNVVKIFENSFETELGQSASLKHSHQPRCKTNLDMRLVSTDAVELYVRPHSSDRSSLYSVPSIEWDYVRKNDSFRTTSLPRSKTDRKPGNLFRTRSHAGFANAYINDPDPMHFHLPRCRSCGTFNSSYAWELCDRKSSFNNSCDNTLRASESTCNIPKKYKEQCENMTATLIANDPRRDQNLQDVQIVSVKETTVPVCNTIKINFPKAVTEEQEWVDCQEFADDNLEDVGGSFSSENQTVIEKISPERSGVLSECVKLTSSFKHVGEVGDAFNKVLIELKEKFNCDKESDKSTVNSLEAEVDSTSDREEDMNNDFGEDPMYGEYLNYSDELDFEDMVYESPVKDLVEKDIRNYSVPMTVYCDDFSKLVQNTSPRKSPSKTKVPVIGSVLEPIQEESKSSYGEESLSAGDDDTKDNELTTSLKEVSTLLTVIEEERACTPKKYDCNDEGLGAVEHRKLLSETIIDIVSIVDEIVLRVFLKINIEIDVPKDRSEYIETVELNKNVEDSQFEKPEYVKVLTLPEKNIHFDNLTLKYPILPEVSRSSNASSSVRDSFDSTAEFERTEAVLDILGVILEGVSMSKKHSEELDKDNMEFLGVVSRRKFKALGAIGLEHNEEKISGHAEDSKNCIEAETILDKSTALYEETESYIVTSEACSENGDFVEKNDLNKHILGFESSPEISQHMKNISESPDQKNRCPDMDTALSEDMEAAELGSFNKKPIRVDVIDKEFYINARTISQSDLESVEITSVEYISDDLEEIKKTFECNEEMNNTLDLTYNVPDIDTQETISEICIEAKINSANNSAPGDCNDENERMMIANNMNTLHNANSIIITHRCGPDSVETGISNNESDLDISKNSIDTDTSPMDVAFVEGSYHESITSSPLNESGGMAIQEFDESPIRNENVKFVSKNLYEREDSLLNSPFIKKASTITMSQTAQRGGIRFWISFDDSLSPRAERPLHRRYRSFENIDDKTPSFLVTKLTDCVPTVKMDDPSASKNVDVDSTADSFEVMTSEDNTLTTLDINESVEFFGHTKRFRKSVLCQGIEREVNESSEDVDRDTLLNTLKFMDASDSFETASVQASDTYVTCEAALSNNGDEVDLSNQTASCSQHPDCVVKRKDEKKIKKLYDSSKAGRSGRGFSWPPFEDTLFYKILSKFRMSESFDPNEYEKLWS